MSPNLSIVIVAWASMLWSCAAGALDEKRLWLPKRYKQLGPDLLRSAIAAEALERCQDVLEGTLDLDQSKPDQPRFRVLCRQADGMSYNEIIDGLTFKPLFTPLDRMKMKEPGLSKVCRKAVSEELTFMQDLIWLTEGSPGAISLDEKVAIFHFDFNASNGFGESLFYRAICTVNKGKPLKVIIVPRRDEQ